MRLSEISRHDHHSCSVTTASGVCTIWNGTGAHGSRTPAGKRRGRCRPRDASDVLYSRSACAHGW